MSEQGYNGWKNYETWAVGLYLDGNYTGQDTYESTVVTVQMGLDYADAHPNVPTIWTQEQADRFAVADHLKNFVHEQVAETNDVGLAVDLLGAALSSVDWDELADAWIENVREQVEA